MGELQSTLDGLADDDLFALGAAELLARVQDLVAARNRIDAELARVVRRSELSEAPEHDGLTSMASWLRGHARLSPRVAHGLVRAGRVLEQLPAVAAVCAAGAVSGEQVAVISPILTAEHLTRAAEHDIDLSAVDEVLAETAATRQYAHLGQVVHHYLARLDPDSPEPDPTEGRSVSMAKHSDGSLSFRGHLDPVGAEKFQAALESFVQADRPAGDGRTRAQQHGDALVQLCDVALACGKLPVLRTVKPHVAATIGLDDLADPHTGPACARMGFGAAISAAQARWLACDGQISRIVFGPDSHQMNLGRTHRVVPPHLRRAVETRDRGCVFTGCDAPTYWCDVHHLIHWIDDGETSLENSALLCERHHTKVHHGFRITRLSDGRWRTWRPDGTEILLYPLLQ